MEPKLLENIYTVSEITNEIKLVLEEGFEDITVIGEISNFKAHVSGHWYFTLKDSNAQISCTMWKGLNKYVFFTLQDGLKIIVKGRITVYPPRGNYQIEVRSIKPAGEGELQAAFERLKKKLAEEGLFDPAIKKLIPKFPTRIGIVTAIDGAAFRDMVNIAGRRYPLVELLILPSRVQGAGAAEDIAGSIKILNSRKDVDLIIIGRGGGSLEDLWAFNEESVARAIHASKIPVISAVGHEIDFTISDFVADLRAPTPSAAMELATPNSDDIFAFIDDFSYNSTNNIKRIMRSKKDSVSGILNTYPFKHPDFIIKLRSQFLDNLLYKTDSLMNGIVKEISNRLNMYRKVFESSDPRRILKKGFTMIEQENKIVTSGVNLDPSDRFKIIFHDKEININ